MDTKSISDDSVLLTLQNNSKPDQIIYLIKDKESGYFRTRGLKDFFGVKEIRVDSNNIAESLPEYAQVLSFLFETMSAAEDLSLPYSYQNEFEFGNERYSLYEEGDYRVLRRIDIEGFSV